MQECIDAMNFLEVGSSRRPAAPHPRSRWPIVIGAISLLLCLALVALVRWMVLHERFLTMKCLRENTAWPEKILPAFQLALAAAMAGMPWFLLDGAANTFLRRRRARGSHLAYAWITLAFVVVFTLIMVSQILYVAPANVWQEPGLIRKLTLATILLDGLLLVYPAFVVLWFRRPRIRKEVREWE